MSENPIFYLYRHIRLDKNEPFYIGIGTVWNRDKISQFSSIYYRRAYVKFNRSQFWKNIVAKTDYDIEILLESDNYGFILEKEVEFIKLYGRKDLNTGTLVNLTDGGKGSRAYVYTPKNTRKGKPYVNIIRRLGKLTQKYSGVITASRKLNIQVNHIHRCLKYKRPDKFGFTWEYDKTNVKSN